MSLIIRAQALDVQAPWTVGLVGDQVARVQMLLSHVTVVSPVGSQRCSVSRFPICQREGSWPGPLGSEAAV